MKNILKSIGWIALNFVIQFLVQMGFSVCAVNRGIGDMAAMGRWVMDRLLLIVIVSNLVFSLIAWLIVRRKKETIREQWKLEKTSARDCLIGCVLAFAYSILFNLLTYNAAENPLSPTHVSAAFFGSWRFAVLALALLVSAPVTEEILCRGIVMNTLKESFSPVWAMIGSSLLFGAMHLMAGGPELAVGAAAMGFVMALVYQKTNSLYAAILAHAVANLPDFILYASPDMGPALRWGGVAVSLGVLLICLKMWWRDLSWKNEKPA